jgi:peptide/nickel transport system permease protein
MRAYIIKRILLMIPTLFGITLISFSIIRLAPGDPAVLKARAGAEGITDQAMAKKIIEQTQRIYGLDKPILLNFHIWNIEKDLSALKVLLNNGEVPFEQKDKLLTKIKRAGKGAVHPAMDEFVSGQGSDAYRENLIDIIINRTSLRVVEGWSLKEKEDYIRTWWAQNEPTYRLTTANKLLMTFTEAQYGNWVKRLVTLDFGESFKDKRPVIDILKERVPVSIRITMTGLFLAYLIAIPIGVFSATHQYSLTDKILTTGLFMLYSMPSFWVATMMIVYLCGGDFWNLFPVSGLHSVDWQNMPFFRQVLDHVWHLILPVVCFTYGSFAFLSRMMRTGMLETIRQDFITTARAKGLSERVVIMKHAFRNSVIPIVTMLSALLPWMIGGSFIIETIFTIPGMGYLGFTSILARDYPVIMAIFTISAFLDLLGILLSDITYALVDPRISYT